MKPFRTALVARFAVLLFLLAGAISPSPPARAASIYRAGEVVEDFTLTDRATGMPVRLSDLAGNILVLDWFAWWCPFCQAAAPELREGIKDHYASRGGNPAGLAVVHLGVNLQPNQETQTANFVARAGFERVLQDFTRAVANRFASGGQPIFAIINGVTNSPSHRPWELLYSRQGYGQTSFPVEEFRAAIDVVQAAPLRPPAPARLSTPALRSDGLLSFTLEGEAGRSYRVESSTDLMGWRAEFEVTATSEPLSMTLPGTRSETAAFVRAVAL